MAYFLTCVHEYYDKDLGHVSRGQAIHDYEKIRQIFHNENRMHHFVKSHNPHEPGQWEWPPAQPTEE